MKVDFKNNRDFVDLTIDFIQNRKYFYFIFTFFVVVLSIYFLQFANYYKFKLIIDVAPESNYVPILNRLNFLRKKPQKILENPFEDFKTYRELSGEVCALIVSVGANDNFYKPIANDFIIDHGYQKTEEMVNSIVRELKDTIEYKKSAVFCTDIELSGGEELILFLEKNYIRYLSNMASKEIISVAKILKKEKINNIESIVHNVDSTKLLEGNLLLLRGLKDIESGFTKFHYNKSDIKKGIGKSFVLMLSFFVSFVFYLFLIIAFDFNKQIKGRRNNN